MRRSIPKFALRLGTWLSLTLFAATVCLWAHSYREWDRFHLDQFVPMGGSRKPFLILVSVETSDGGIGISTGTARAYRNEMMLAGFYVERSTTHGFAYGGLMSARHFPWTCLGFMNLEGKAIVPFYAVAALFALMPTVRARRWWQSRPAMGPFRRCKLPAAESPSISRGPAMTLAYASKSPDLNPREPHDGGQDVERQADAAGPRRTKWRFLRRLSVAVYALLLVAIASLWVRSHYVADVLSWQKYAADTAGGMYFGWLESSAITSGSGGVRFTWSSAMGEDYKAQGGFETPAGLVTDADWAAYRHGERPRRLAWRREPPPPDYDQLGPPDGYGKRWYMAGFYGLIENDPSAPRQDVFIPYYAILLVLSFPLVKRTIGAARHHVPRRR